MFKYKYTGSVEVSFRAASDEKNIDKKVYIVKPNEEIILPVKISLGNMEFIEEVGKGKTKKGVE